MTPQPTKPTDEQLKRALVKLVGESVVKLYQNPQFPTLGVYRWMHDGHELLDTELLDLCWRVEERLTEKQRISYSSVMEDKFLHGEFGYDFYYLHATWQQRVIALAQVLRVEIFMKTELLPCPFCGGVAYAFTFKVGASADFIGIKCSECKVEKSKLLREDAIKAWNTRAPQPPAESEDKFVEGLKHAHRMCEQVYHASKYEADVEVTAESYATNRAVENCQKAIDKAIATHQKGE